MDIELKKQIKKHLCTFKSAEDIFELFKLLNYPEENIFDTSYKRDKKDFEFKKEDYERIKNVYSVLNFEDNLPVFLLETTSLAPSFVRSVSNKFDSQYMRFLLILVDENYSEMIFTLPNREKVEEGKYRLKITKLVVNKEDIKERNEYYTIIDTLSKIVYENEDNWREIWLKWRKSFDVEKVTEAFFEDYKKIFFTLRKTIQSYLISPKDAHEYTLQFLNRIMFIYFISKKGWLKYPKFMHWFWRSYKEQNNFGSNEFHEKWLNQVFFKGLNNRAYEVKDLPQDIKEVISSFPYLNGGLFKENKVDNCPVKIKDEMFQKIFEFFEKYNFTIREDMAFESEVSVDPQMIGYVYETLASLSSKDVDIYVEHEKKEDAESRRKWGIFYTPIVEVDFMCRRSLVEYLANQIPKLPKDLIYHFVFDAPGESDETEKYLTKEGWWDQIEDILDKISIVDPACGSGAFLVGMMNILSEIYGKIYKYTDTNLDDYQMKYRIIQRSLYGVDVMKWAVQAAELRLWLQLIIETNIKGEELRKSPLLPNLNLNLRIGDSLVQEIGGMNFNVRSNDIDYSLKKKLEELKHEKAQYFENPQRAKYKNIEAFHKQELKLFNSLIDSRIKILQKEIESKKRRSKSKQVTLSTKTIIKAKDFEDKSNKKILANIKEKKTQIQNLMKMKKTLTESEKKPFIWEIDFAEIFGDKNGFDIVIGNPPYIRQEKIAPPEKNKLTVSLEDKQEYKEKLNKSVQNQFSVVDKVDKKSDYFIYFYFHGLSLLNEKGTFCFITSNSWLDVEYGKYLQEFLLKYVPLKAIYDNPKRSFLHADVNTIISLFGAPKLENSNNSELKTKENNDGTLLDHVAKFVMFKKPFEQIIYSENFIEIENIMASKGSNIIELVENVTENESYRVFPVIQEDLLREGSSKTKKPKSNLTQEKFIGDKWGSKFLKIKDITIKILKTKKIGKISDYAKIITVAWSREGSKSKIVKRISEIDASEIDYYLLNSPRDSFKINIKKEDIQKVMTNTKLLKSKPLYAPILLESARNDKHITRKVAQNIYFAHNFTGVIPKNFNIDLICVLLNSTLSWLFFENFGRTGLGQGALTFTTNDFKKVPLILKPEILSDQTQKKLLKCLKNIEGRDIGSAFYECGFNPIKPIKEQEPRPLQDRAELDNIIFDELGLTDTERKEVYWGVCELVKQRLDKANSLKESQ